MADDQQIDKKFYRDALYTRLMDLKRIQLIGREVDVQEIESLEKEVYPELSSPERKGEGLLGQKDVDELQLYISLAEPKPEWQAAIKVDLFRAGHTVLRMRAERNHNLPHFHIEYKQEHKASYSIETLERIAGYVPNKFEQPILEWASQRRRELKLTWDKLKAGEDIRELVLTAEEA
jgi:hypothetical protein